MKIVVFGASGHTGRLLIRGALDEGHAVTAFVRNPAALDIEHPALTVVQGDVLEPATVEPAVRGQDAVLIALGVPKGGPKDLCSAGTRNIVAAMHEAGVRRVICLSALGVGDSKQHSGLFGRMVAPVLMKDWLADKEGQEQALRDSELDWTIVRPPRLEEGPETGSYRAGTDISAGLSSKASYADVAAFMRRQIADDTYLRRAPSIFS